MEINVRFGDALIAEAAVAEVGTRESGRHRDSGRRCHRRQLVDFRKFVGVEAAGRTLRRVRAGQAVGVIPLEAVPTQRQRRNGGTAARQRAAHVHLRGGRTTDGSNSSGHDGGTITQFVRSGSRQDSRRTEASVVVASDKCELASALHDSDRFRIVEMILSRSLVALGSEAVILELVLAVLVTFENFVYLVTTEVTTTTTAN